VTFTSSSTALPPETLLLGPLSVDRYPPTGVELPGGGALNMAYHWSRSGRACHLLSRIGDDFSEMFLAFFRGHRIGYSATSIVAHGVTPSIDVVIGPDRQPKMENFVEGVWAGFRLTSGEQALLATARQMHVVLVGDGVAEIERLGRSGHLDHLMVSGDFLSLRRFSIERFTRTLEHLDIGFIGWPEQADHPTLTQVRNVVFDLGKLAVVTLGAAGVLVFDGRSDQMERFIPVDAVPVVGTSVGCGDAFISGFLGWYYLDPDLDRAIEAGKELGAQATVWQRPLPDSAYRL
jgi:fructoselysine 6-kinase